MLMLPGSLIDYIAVSGTMERNVLEYVDHLHEHFLYPCSINQKGRYNVPCNPMEGYRWISAFPVCKILTQDMFLHIALKCTSRASRSTSGRTGHIGQRRRQVRTYGSL